MTSLYFATPLAFNTPTEGFPWDDLRKILHGCQRMAKVQNGEEILPKVSTPWVGRTTVSVFRKFWSFTKNFVTMRVGRLISDDRSSIWNLRTQKGWGSWRMMKEFPSNKSWKRRSIDKVIKKIDREGTTARKPGSERPTSVRTDANMELVSEPGRQTAQPQKPARNPTNKWHFLLVDSTYYQEGCCA